jgi:ankyrin repeat protein
MLILLLCKPKFSVSCRDFVVFFVVFPHLIQPLESEAVVQLQITTCKVDIDAKDCLGQTPLSRAAGNGHEAVVQLLIATGNV